MNNIEKIKEKANYCIGCIKKPCQQKCPLNNDTTGFIKLIKEEKYQDAYELLCETTILQSICGRICPHSKQCQSGCIRGIKGEPVSIGNLEAFIGDLAIEENWPIQTKIKKQEKIEDPKILKEIIVDELFIIYVNYFIKLHIFRIYFLNSKN